MGDDIITRDDARDAAGREVSKPVYHSDDPGPVERAYNQVIDWIGDLFDRAAGAAPGGGAGLVAILAVLAALIVVLLVRVGPLSRSRRGSVLDQDAPVALTAADHRRLADQFAAAGQFAEAVRERMRAIVRELESRGVLVPRPGRTADEVAREAGAEVPDLAGSLREAARIFDEVWYGGRPATAESAGTMRDVDERLRRTTLGVSTR